MSTPSFPLRLDRALTKGATTIVKLNPTNKASPVKGFVWLILSGYISHITGTISHMKVQEKTDAYRIFETHIPAANASADISLFSNQPTQDAGQFQLIFVQDNEQIYFGGGTGAVCHIKVLEWQVRP